MKNHNISDAELEVLKELWDESPLSSRQLVDRLMPRTNWGEATIKTLLLRLLRKKAVRRQNCDKLFFYSAVVKRGEYQYDVGRSMLNNLFDGMAGNFLTCLVENDHLTPEEIAELKALLDKHEETAK